MMLFRNILPIYCNTLTYEAYLPYHCICTCTVLLNLPTIKVQMSQPTSDMSQKAAVPPFSGDWRRFGAGLAQVDERASQPSARKLFTEILYRNFSSFHFLIFEEKSKKSLLKLGVLFYSV